MARVSKSVPPPASEPRPPLWRVLVLATRPNTLTASFTPVAVGAAIAFREVGSAFHLAPCLEFWLFAGLIQIGTNLHNDYADFVKGADTHERLGQARATQKGWLTPVQTAGGAVGTLGLAFLVGAHLSATRGCGGWMAFVTLSSIFNAFAYTGGDFPLGYLGLGWVSLGYSGLGDLFVLLYFGGVATSAPFYLHQPAQATPFQLKLPGRLAVAMGAVGALGTAIIVVNNLRDRHTDVKANKRTLAVRFGQKFAKAEYALLLGAAYALMPFAMLTCGCSGIWLLPMLSLPLAKTQFLAVVSQKDGGALNEHVGGTAKLQLAFGLLLIAAILLE